MNLLFLSAVTQVSCDFQVEFHLPSGGDTDLIDKQFLTTLTDSYKSIKLTLVSPRYKPDFGLPVIKNKPDLDRVLRILLPAIYALGSAIVLLLLLLIYGYKTRPRDKMQRDRDSKLHFRHVLFVIWFVGMRLIKSFLLTLTLFYIIFSAIHYRDVNTLNRYSEFTQQRQEIEKKIVSQMDAHKVQELNRQLSLLNAGKEHCDERLRQADDMIDAYYAEMRRRLFEEMKEKSIIYAAYKQTEKKAKEAKKKIDRKRQDINRQLKSFTNEMINIIQSIRNRVEGNFWLKAAKFLHGFLKVFGKPGPFMNWVGLDVSFPGIDINIGSFDSLFDDFLKNFEIPKFNLNSTKFPKLNISLPNTDLRLNLNEISFPSLDISSPISSKRTKELLVLDWVVAFARSGVLAGILVVLDIMWFVFRHGKTYQSVVILLHGFPVVHDLDKIKEKKEKEKKLKKSESRLSESVDSIESVISSSASAVIQDPEEIVSLNETSELSTNKTVKLKDSNTRKVYFQDEDKKKNIKQNANSKTTLKDDNSTNVTKDNKRTIILHGEDGKQESTDSLNEETECKETKHSSSTLIRFFMVMLDYLNTAVFFVFRLLKRLNYEVGQYLLTIHFFILLCALSYYQY